MIRRGNICSIVALTNIEMGVLQCIHDASAWPDSTNTLEVSRDDASKLQVLRKFRASGHVAFVNEHPQGTSSFWQFSPDGVNRLATTSRVGSSTQSICVRDSISDDKRTPFEWYQGLLSDGWFLQRYAGGHSPFPLAYEPGAEKTIWIGSGAMLPNSLYLRCLAGAAEFLATSENTSIAHLQDLRYYKRFLEGKRAVATVMGALEDDGDSLRPLPPPPPSAKRQRVAPPAIACVPVLEDAEPNGAGSDGAESDEQSIIDELGRALEIHAEENKEESGPPGSADEMGEEPIPPADENVELGEEIGEPIAPADENAEMGEDIREPSPQADGDDKARASASSSSSTSSSSSSSSSVAADEGEGGGDDPPGGDGGEDPSGGPVVVSLAVKRILDMATASLQKKKRRWISWGGYKIASVHKGKSDLPTGWGATCGRHKNANDKGTVCCKTTITLGPTMEDAEAILRIKQWLLLGQSIPPDSPNGRKLHLGMRPRQLELWTTEEIDFLKPVSPCDSGADDEDDAGEDFEPDNDGDAEGPAAPE
jgi:hypothetical protein